MNHDKNVIKSNFFSRRCQPNLAKHWLLVMNTLIVLTGVALFGVGIYSIINHSFPNEFAAITADIRCLILGITAVLLSILGLSAAYKETIKWLKLYLGILIVDVLLKSVYIIWEYSRIDQASMQRHSASKIDMYGSVEMVTQIVDLVQNTTSCCGLDTTALNTGNYPENCCSEQQGGKWIITVSNVSLYAIIIAQIWCMRATIHLVLFLEKYKDQKISIKHNNFI